MTEEDNKKKDKPNINSESTLSGKDKKDSKTPLIISQTSGYLDSIDDELNDECLMTVIELNDGTPKSDCSESSIKNTSDKPKKFRINLVKYRRNLEMRKSKLLEEKENFEIRLKRFPGYMMGNLGCVSHGDYEPPISSNSEVDQNRTIGKRFSTQMTASFPIKQKIKADKTTRKVIYSVQEEAVKFFEALTEVKIKTDEDYDQIMIRRFPLGNVLKDKIFMTIIYVPECEILRKQFIGFYGLNFEKLNMDEFESWCHKNQFYNSKFMYESYFENGNPRECSFMLKGLMTKYQVGIVLSDFFRTRDSAAYRAIAVFGDALSSVQQCVEEFKTKLPVNILPYLHENPNDESSLAPGDFEEIDYFRRNYHRLMFSEDVYF